MTVRATTEVNHLGMVADGCSVPPIIWSQDLGLTGSSLNKLHQLLSGISKANRGNVTLA